MSGVMIPAASLEDGEKYIADSKTALRKLFGSPGGHHTGQGQSLELQRRL